MKNSTYLWITPKWPLPPHDGARLATVSLITELARLGEIIDLLVIAGDDEAADPQEAQNLLGVQTVWVIRRKSENSKSRRLWAWARSGVRDPKLPLTLSAFASHQVQAEIESILSRGYWDYLVYDGMHGAGTTYSAGQYVRPKSAGAVIYRAHNFETELWQKSATATHPASWVRRQVLMHQHRQVERFEVSLTKAADWIATVSEVDKQKLKKIAPDQKVTSIPIGLKLKHPPSLNAPPQDTKILLFVGRLDWHPNTQGLIWFLREIWPEVYAQRKDLSFWIAGSGDATPLQSSIRQEGIRFLGRVEDLSPLYEKCTATVIPLFYGSGIRVKAIESCHYGRTCISTPAGIEGLDLQRNRHFVCAETREEWIRALTHLSQEHLLQLGRSAQAFAHHHYNAVRVAQSWLQLKP